MPDLIDREALGAAKAFPPSLWDMSIAEVAQAGLTVHDLLLPAMVLKAPELAHNVDTMSRWCLDQRVALAPHGKTTMAPQLFAMQMNAGAWGITAASVSQAAVMHRHGVRRILIANQVVDEPAHRWLAHVLSSDSEVEIYCLVDSVDGARLLADGLRRHGASRPLGVLIEVGMQGRRAGARTEAEALTAAINVAETSELALAGIECFEGVVPGIDAAAYEQVNGWFDRVISVAEELDSRGAFAVENVILTAGGSVFFDQCVRFKQARLSNPPIVIVRSGCYLTHDTSGYDPLSPWGSVRHLPGGPELKPALELRSAILSVPEPGLAIAGFGKRDAPFDAGYPTLLSINGIGTSADEGTNAAVTAMHDQHAFVAFSDDVGLRVGDALTFGIAHPCTAFDKWSALPMVDDAGRVIQVIRTRF